MVFCLGPHNSSTQRYHLTIPRHFPTVLCCDACVYKLELPELSISVLTHQAKQHLNVLNVTPHNQQTYIHVYVCLRFRTCTHKAARYKRELCECELHCFCCTQKYSGTHQMYIILTQPGVLCAMLLVCCTLIYSNFFFINYIRESLNYLKPRSHNAIIKSIFCFQPYKLKNDKHYFMSLQHSANHIF